MSWFQSLRDEFSLRPCEIEPSHSTSAAMSSGHPDVTANQEPAEVVEECSGKKKSKFQTFKKFFARKKRKEPPGTEEDAGLTGSRSSDNVTETSQNNMLTRSETGKGSGSKISQGSKALSHDSVFVSEASEATEALGASQDSIHGKVKSLQLQLKQAIRLGSPPSLMCVKRTDDAGAMSEDDGLPCSPHDYTTAQTVMSNSSISLEGIECDSDQTTSRAVSPLVVPGDFSQPASPFGCLDNSAAKHKLGLRHKAGNRRKPAARLEMRAGGDSAVEDILDSSPAEAPEEREQYKTAEVVSVDELKPKADREEEGKGGEEEDEDEEEEQPRHSLLRHEEEKEEEEEREEGADQPEAEQDVCHGPDSSSPVELCLCDEEAADAEAQPASQPSSRGSSLDSPETTPEPPAAQREYLLDPPGIAYGAEKRWAESDLALSGEEDEAHGNVEEESSFLQEVLSSLKTPLSSCSLDREPAGVVLEMEEEELKGREREDVDLQEGEEVIEEEAHSLEEEVPALNTPSGRDVEEEEEEEEEESPEEEAHVVEKRADDGEKKEADEVTPDERDDAETSAVNQAEGKEDEDSEGEEEAIELEKEPEVEEEGREKTEEEEEEEEEELDEAEVVEVRVEEAEEATEEEKEGAEEVTETFHGAADEEAAVLPQAEEEGVDVRVGDVGWHLNNDETELGEAAAHQSPAASDRSSRGKNEDGEGKVEKVVEIGQAEHQSEDEEDEKERDPQQKSAEMCKETLPGSQESRTSKTSKTSIHINLLSPSSEKATPFFQSSPAAADTNEEEPAVNVEAEEEENHSALEGEATVGEGPNQPPSDSDRGKERFAIAPAWRRSLSFEEAEESSPNTSPSSFTGPVGVEAEAANNMDSQVEAEPASLSQVELVLSPGRLRSASAAPPPSSIQPPTTASREESPVPLEGNPDSPFGVRLRKTLALHTEPAVEPPAQPTSCKVDSPHPISMKPSISQPVSLKPSLSKKPDLNKRMSDPAAARGLSGGSDPPSWISVAKQKQKIYKENSLDEITVRKEEQERKGSVLLHAGSADSREHSNRTTECKANQLESSKHCLSVDKEPRRSLSPPTPVPPQPLKCPVPPKPPLPPCTHKHPPQPTVPQRSLSPPAPITEPKKSPPCAIPPSPSKPATSPKTPQPSSTTPASPPFASRVSPEPKSGSRGATGVHIQTPPCQRGPPPAASPQDEPPWMALAKKKAKAWSEMPQIVQ
ncbi:uncharacterized protein AB9W97_006414 isoform 2-T2 [Spinachia spinachia]